MKVRIMNSGKILGDKKSARVKGFSVIENHYFQRVNSSYNNIV